MKNVRIRFVKNIELKIRVNLSCFRFHVLWRSRHQVWPRLDEGGKILFKVPPHGIEFTIPSPKVGVECLQVVDPPWMPHIKPNVEEVTLSQMQHRSFITANRTRHKLQEEMVKIALKAEESKRRTERQSFPLSTVPVNNQAAYEPAMHTVIPEDHEQNEDNKSKDQKVKEMKEEEILRRGRRESVTKPREEPSEVENPGGRGTTSLVTVSQQLFPSSLCSAVITIIHLLDDPAVTSDGMAVYQVAHEVIWSCLVEDSALFLRFFLEKLTREKQEVMIRLLRRLIRFVPNLPSQAAFALYNYMVGYVMFLTRTNSSKITQNISNAHAILWNVVHGLRGIMFKDLKQIFRKEQCDMWLLLTANVPSAKALAVEPPAELHGCIPNQFSITEETQFCTIMEEAREYFGISEAEKDNYFLFDCKTNAICNPSHTVRDFYFFKKTGPPILQLSRMDSQEGIAALQQAAFTHKLTEMSKVLMTLVIMSQDQTAQRVFFLHEELTKLPAFPRKALDAEFDLFKCKPMGKELLSVNQLHKYAWVQLVCRMLEGMAGNLTYTTDLHLFINVINGGLIMHCEESAMLRLCLATYINAANIFNNLFASSGYMLVMPTVLRVYSNYSSNKMVVAAIEYAVKQLYILHRKPFVLQMLGSVASVLDTEEHALYGDANKVQPRRLFDLLVSLERPNNDDALHILDLVTCEKPLEPLDFCYAGESDNLGLLDTLDLCIMIISLSADSKRGRQMFTILDSTLSMMLIHLQKPKDMKQQKIVHHLACSMKTMIVNCEPLIKNYTGPQKAVGDGRGSSRVTYGRASRISAPGIEADDDSNTKYYMDSRRHDKGTEASEVVHSDFRRPRDTLLHIVAEFLSKSSALLTRPGKRIQHLDCKISDLLDTKCHLRLADVALTLLKVAPYDSATMGCRGLRRYMNEILPHPDWNKDELRPALINILRRLDKMFLKIVKNSQIRRNTDWEAAACLLQGLYQTMQKFTFIAVLPQLRSVLQVCQSLVVGERISDVDAGVGLTGNKFMDLESGFCEGDKSSQSSPPPYFCAVVIRLIALHVSAIGGNYSLEVVCGGSPVFPTQKRTENLIVNLLLPLCLRVGCGRKDVPRVRLPDLRYALSVILFALNPPLAKVGGATTVAQATLSGVKSAVVGNVAAGSGDRAPSTWQNMDVRGPIYPRLRTTLLRAAFLGLKVLLVCFGRHMSGEYLRIVHCLKDFSARGQVGGAFWDFIDFTAYVRTPLFLLMRPFIISKLRSNDVVCEQYKDLIKGRLNCLTLPRSKSRGTLLIDLASQLASLKNDILTSFIHTTIETSNFSADFTAKKLNRNVESSTARDAMSPSQRSQRGSFRFSLSNKNGNDQPRLQRNRGSSIMRKRMSSSSLVPNANVDGQPMDNTPGGISYAARACLSSKRSNNSYTEVSNSFSGVSSSVAGAGNSSTGTSNTGSPIVDDVNNLSRDSSRHRLQRQQAQGRRSLR